MRYHDARIPRAATDVSDLSNPKRIGRLGFTGALFPEPARNRALLATPPGFATGGTMVMRLIDTDTLAPLAARPVANVWSADTFRWLCRVGTETFAYIASAGYDPSAMNVRVQAFETSAAHAPDGGM